MRRGRLRPAVRLGVESGALSQKVRWADRTVCHLCDFSRFDRGGVALQQGLPTLIDAAVPVVRLSLLDACHRPLLTIVEASKDCTLGDVVADVGTQIDDEAGRLEANLGCDACLDRAEAEDLQRHVSFGGGNLNSTGRRNISHSAIPTPTTAASAMASAPMRSDLALPAARSSFFVATIGAAFVLGLGTSSKSIPTLQSRCCSCCALVAALAMTWIKERSPARPDRRLLLSETSVPFP